MKQAAVFAPMAVSICAQNWTPSRIVAITEYPKLANAARVQGTVEVKCILDPNGGVTDAEVISGNQMLREAARENAVLWKFQRTSKDAVSNSVTLKYVFLLEGEPQSDTAATFVFEPPDKIQIVAPINYIRGAP